MIEIKARLLKMLEKTKTISVGDHAPLFALPDENEKYLIIRDQVGKPSILIFYAKDEIPECKNIACEFRDLMPTLKKFEVQVFSISTDAPESRKEFSQTNQINFPLLSDVKWKVSQQYGVYFEEQSNSEPIRTYTRTAILLDINLRIVKIYNLGNVQKAIAQLLTDIQTVLPREEPRQITMQAPVLLIPNVLDLELCKYLIDVWETEGNDESGSMRREGDKTIGVLNYNHKIRRDHFIKRQDLLKLLDRLVRRRVFPEIEKVFAFPVTRREDYRIGCYDSSRGGYFRTHRDNTTGGTAHRRFAMSLNLNTGEYEGGYLRFPEYGPHLYKPDTGSAVIFSCSLMHEATDVTLGRRFGLFCFLYGEKEAEERTAYESRVQNDYSVMLKVNAEVSQETSRSDQSLAAASVQSVTRK